MLESRPHSIPLTVSINTTASEGGGGGSGVFLDISAAIISNEVNLEFWSLLTATEERYKFEPQKMTI